MATAPSCFPTVLLSSPSIKDQTVLLPTAGTLAELSFTPALPFALLDSTIPIVHVIRPCHTLLESVAQPSFNGLPWAAFGTELRCRVRDAKSIKISALKQVRVEVRFVGLLGSTMGRAYIGWNYLLLAAKVCFKDLISKSLRESQWIAAGTHLCVEAIGNKCVFLVRRVVVNGVLECANAALELPESRGFGLETYVESPELFAFRDPELRTLAAFYENVFAKDAPAEIYREFNANLFLEACDNKCVLFNMFSGKSDSTRKLLHERGLLSPLFALISSDPRFTLLYLSAALALQRDAEPMYIDCDQFYYFHRKNAAYRESDFVSSRERVHDFSLLLSEAAAYINEKAPTRPKAVIVSGLHLLPHAALVAFSLWLRSIAGGRTETYVLCMFPAESEDKLRTVESVLGLAMVQVRLDSADAGIKRGFAEWMLENVADVQCPYEVVGGVKGQIMRAIKNECANVETTEIISTLNKIVFHQ